VREPADDRRLLVLPCNNRVAAAMKKVPLHKLKIPIVVFQILTQYADITSVEFPAVFERFLSYVDLVNLDLGWVLSATCLVDVNFYGRLLLTTLAPLALLCVLGCTYLVARDRVVRAARLPTANGGIHLSNDGFGEGNMSESRALSVVNTKHMGVLMTLTFLLYSTVSTIVFETFECDHLDELGESYLRADYHIVCYTPKHNKYMVYSALMILV
ncbi:unnamed protein product, partial [Sphacelaria rigidula]